MVLKEVPAGSTVVGIPGTIVKRYGQSTQDLNQVDLPDPVAVEIECLRKRIVALENLLRQSGCEIEIPEETCEECREECGDENL